MLDTQSREDASSCLSSTDFGEVLQQLFLEIEEVGEAFFSDVEEPTTNVGTTDTRGNTTSTTNVETPYARGIIWTGVLLLQVLNVGHSLLVKAALNQGMHASVCACYRNLICCICLWAILPIRRSPMPTMTLSVIWRIIVLSILEPVVSQNSQYAASSNTSMGFSSFMSGLIPVMTFILAVIFRLEDIHLHLRFCQLKLLGTVFVAVGAGLVVLRSGSPLVASSLAAQHNFENWFQGPIFVIIGIASSAGHSILLKYTLNLYNSPAMLVACTSTIGVVLNFILTVGLRGGVDIRWRIKWDLILATYFYGGVIISAFGFWLAGRLIEKRGPVFVRFFNPVSGILIFLIDFLALKGETHVGSIIGLVVANLGLITYLWGNWKEKKEIAEAERLSLA